MSCPISMVRYNDCMLWMYRMIWDVTHNWCRVLVYGYLYSLSCLWRIIFFKPDLSRSKFTPEVIQKDEYTYDMSALKVLCKILFSFCFALFYLCGKSGFSALRIKMIPPGSFYSCENSSRNEFLITVFWIKFCHCFHLLYL